MFGLTCFTAWMIEAENGLITIKINLNIGAVLKDAKLPEMTLKNLLIMKLKFYFRKKIEP